MVWLNRNDNNALKKRKNVKWMKGKKAAQKTGGKVQEISKGLLRK